MGYTEQEKYDIFSIYVKNNKNPHEARSEYRELYPNRHLPCKNTFKNMDKLIRNTGSLKRKRRTINHNEDEDLNILLYFEGM